MAERSGHPNTAVNGAGQSNDTSTEARLLELTHDLIERIKELNCLYGISRLREQRDISLDEIMQGVVELIPPAWQYPEITCACIKFRNRMFKTANFRETVWKQAENIIVSGKKAGSIEIYYLEGMPDVFEGPFLKEERDLIHGIAERVGHIIESRTAEDNLLRMYARERKLYKKLQSEMESRVNFTRLLIHELKTPLTSLMATSQLLQEETQNSRLEKLARYVWDGANGLNFRIDELNDVIRGETGRLKLELKTVNIEELASSIVEETKALSQQYGVPIYLELDEKLPEVSADPGRVRQIMLNLINNAYKYAAEGGKITIRAIRGPDSVVVIEVKDYGAGIARDKQRRLFKPEYQIPNRFEQQGGLGIGLALCKTLVELHGGRIWLESKVGKGSSFFFTLPAVDKTGKRQVSEI